MNTNSTTEQYKPQTRLIRAYLRALNARSMARARGAAVRRGALAPVLPFRRPLRDV
ncbi:hypothetical protein [Burkholderia gladioli]|uniref:hypothetical protein n=1 Tax=Burkholderia gladioli TaxID=28095 RepID=UPI00163ED7BF|nr:hypothetical protein [Burkholderia gladioli]